MFKKIIILSSLILSSQIIGFRVNSTSLDEAIQLLYRNSNQLKSEKFKVKIAKAGVAATVLNIAPDIRYSRALYQSVDVTYLNGHKRSLDTKDKKIYNLQSELSLGNLILDPGRSGQNLELSKTVYRINEQSIILQAIASYLGVLRDEAIFKTSQDNVLVLAKYSELVKRRFELGEVTKTDVEQSIARLFSMKSNNIQNEGILAVSKARYQKIFGVAPNNLVFPPCFPEIPKNFQEFNQLSEKSNLELRKSELNKVISKYDLAKSANSLLPSIHSSVVTIKNSDKLILEDNIRKEERYEINLKIPLLPRGGSEYARVLQSKFAFNSASYDYANASLELKEQITSSWQDLQTNNASVEAAKSTLEYNRLAMNAVKKEAQYGLRTVLNVLDAELEYFNANVNLIKVQYTQMISYYKLLAIMGNLDKNTFSN